MRFQAKYILTTLVMALVWTGCSSSQQTAAPANAEQRQQRAADPIGEATKNTLKLEGLFTFYQDTTSGSTKMVINEDQIGKEFIYWGHTVDGVTAVGHFRGNYRDNKVFKIERKFDRIEFVVQNTSFHFDEDSPLSRAADANISPAILVSEKIAAHDTTSGQILINADTIFLSESLHQIKPSPIPGLPPGARFNLGNLSRDKTAYTSINSYPENSAVVVRYVYDSPFASGGGGTAVTDSRSVAINYQHTFIEMPDDGFVPRRDDPRIGYFGQTVNDQTAVGPTPYRDVINRWRLEKQNPDAELSEPVKPITWWIENTTPYEFRDLIADATLRWNKAFEAAGFINAVDVQVQPDDADWDAGDIRYNVLRWTSSPQPPFGGYGPSFTNPRTGEIIGADIMLEYVFFRNALNSERLFSEDAVNYFLNIHDHDHEMPEIEGGVFCSAGHMLHLNNMFGYAATKALGMDELTEERLVHEALVYLIMHELGHTFGLNHNMGSHNMLDPQQVHDRSLTESKGMIGSVMDYSAINVAYDSNNQGQFYTTVAGPYDIWAIEYGYSVALDDAEAEEARLTAIAQRSTEPDLFFGNDADDMRSPGKAIDPRINTGAMSSDPIAYTNERVQVIERILDNLVDNYAVEGESYQALYNAFMSSMGQKAGAMNVTSRFIGGVYIDRGFVGQEGATQPYTPVPAADQKRALETLSKHLFAPDAFHSSHEVYNLLQRQRRFFSNPFSGEDPKIHDMALGMQRNVLAHILHPNTTKRITDSRLYGNEYPLADFMNDLTDAIFAADLRSNVNTFRQNLQVQYVSSLASVLRENNNPYDFVTRSAALYSLERINGMMNNRSRGNAETQAHTRHIIHLIKSTLDN